MSPNLPGRPIGKGKPASLYALVQAAQQVALGPKLGPSREPRHYPTKPKGIIQGPMAKTQANLARYAELFALRDEHGAPLTLEAIGQRIGVTRERVRQVRKRYFPELDSIKVDRKAYIHQRTAAQRIRNPWIFRRIVRGWLAAQGYFQCSNCWQVKCLDDRSKLGVMASSYIGHGRCKSCSADLVRKWWLTPHGKASAKAWQQANAAKLREYHRRHREKKRRERLNANRNN